MKFRGQVAGLGLDQPDLLVFDGGGHRRKPRQTQSEQNNSDRSVVHQDVTQPSKCELIVLTISLSHTSTCCSSAARLRFLPIFLNLDSAWLHPLLHRPWVGVLPVAVLAAFPHPPPLLLILYLAGHQEGGPFQICLVLLNVSEVFLPLLLSSGFLESSWRQFGS